MAMTKKLYNLMDWAEIEAVTYAEEDQPKAVLGAHPVRGGQTLVTAYKPDAAEVSVKVKGTRASVKMELADEDGYFAALLKNREPFEYELEIRIHFRTVLQKGIFRNSVQEFITGFMRYLVLM